MADFIEKAVAHENKRGLHWFTTGLFVVGELAGAGIVALPSAMIQCDFYPGLVITAIMTVIAAYTAHLLGLSWVILQKRWPEYREHCRKPYPEMAGRAMGKKMKIIVSASIAVTQFGIAVVFLLLSAKNIGDFIEAFFDTDFSFCYIILIVGGCLLPITMLKSPMDFWWAVVIAMVTTMCAVILILVGSLLDYGTCAGKKEINTKFVATNYFLALGTFMFSYGSHSAFPTIIHDMHKPYQFNRSSILAFGIIAAMYTPVTVVGFIVYGNSLQDSIINSIQIVSLQQAINILITVHCILTLTIVFNPLNQEFEEIFEIPQQFCWQRIIIRTATMAAVLFVAESLPSFGPLMDLVGGSTVTLTSLVCPCLFYLYLSADEQLSHDKKIQEPVTYKQVIEQTPKLRLTICSLIMLVGVIGGIAATYSAIKELATTRFVTPCYVRPFLNSTDNSSSKGQINCCGLFQNISRSGDSSVCSPYSDFYNQHLFN